MVFFSYSFQRAALVLPLLVLYSSNVVLLVESFSNNFGVTSKTSLSLRSTTVGIPSTTLIPPSEINTDETAALFEERVQKTYG